MFAVINRSLFGAVEPIRRLERSEQDGMWRLKVLKIRVRRGII